MGYVKDVIEVMLTVYVRGCIINRLGYGVLFMLFMGYVVRRMCG